MSAIDTRIGAGFYPQAFGGRLAASINTWRNARSTRKALNRLSDRELDDIGLCRGDIEQIARGS